MSKNYTQSKAIMTLTEEGGHRDLFAVLLLNILVEVPI